MEYSQFITWAFQAVMGLGALSIVQSLKKLQQSVEELNMRVATVIEKTSWHEKELEKHDIRIIGLENKR